jgi:hypothetical protein
MTSLPKATLLDSVSEACARCKRLLCGAFVPPSLRGSEEPFAKVHAGCDAQDGSHAGEDMSFWGVTP